MRRLQSPSQDEARSTLELLKQIVERRPRIARVANRGVERIARWLLSGSGRWSTRGIARHCYTRLKEITFVGRVLGRNAHRHGLQTLEARGRLEIRALLAAMQSHAALGTGAFEICVRSQRRGAVVTSGRRHRLHQPREARTRYVDGRTGTLRPRTIIPPVASIF